MVPEPPCGRRQCRAAGACWAIGPCSFEDGSPVISHYLRRWRADAEAAMDDAGWDMDRGVYDHQPAAGGSATKRRTER
jgi:hypothetical protein